VTVMTFFRGIMTCWRRGYPRMVSVMLWSGGFGRLRTPFALGRWGSFG